MKRISFKNIFSGFSIGRLLFLLSGSFIVAAGFSNIHACSVVTEGGVLGLSLLIREWTGLSPAVGSLVLDAVCYFIGYKALGGGFLVYSAISAGSYSLFYALLEPYAPLVPAFVSSPLAAAVSGAVFVGVGAGLGVLGGGAMGGDDALAMGLDKRFHCGVRRVYLISDITVLLLSLTYIPAGKIAWSLLTVTLSGLIIGRVIKTGVKIREKKEIRA